MDKVMTYKSRLTFQALYPILAELQSYQYSIIKGEALSLLAYNSVGRRMSSDIDILVTRQSLQVFESKLLDSGFKKREYENTTDSKMNRVLTLATSHQSEPLYLQRGPLKCCVDLNFDVFWGEYTGKRINISEFLSDTIDLDIYGVKVKSLTPMKAMIQLILHHYKDLNSIYLIAKRKSINCNLFKDVYYLLMNHKEEISLEKFYSLALQYEIVPYVYFVLYYTNIIYPDKILKEYVRAFQTLEGELLLNCYGLNDNERKEWKYDIATRLSSGNLYELIRDDLTKQDLEKIAINMKVFSNDK